MAAQEFPVWKQAPFLRLFIPFAAGITLQYYVSLPLTLSIFTWIISVTLLSLFFFLKSSWLFTLYWLPGILVNLLFIFSGSLIVFAKDPRNAPCWIGNYADQRSLIFATPIEEIAEKRNTFKVTASVDKVITGNK